MKEHEIDLIVDKLVERLKAEHLIKPPTDIEMGEQIIKECFSGPVWNTTNLHGVMGDRYYEILPAYYGNGFSLEYIARCLNCDVSTISRHKKRLCREVYVQKIANLCYGKETQ